jgi:small ligand-binding sensory domain FIST
MPFSVALSTASDAARAAEEAGQSALHELGRAPDLAVAFYSPHLAADAADMAQVLNARLGAKALLGILGESVIAGSREVEDRPGVSVWLAAWDEDVSVDAFHLDLEQTPDGPTLFGWPDSMFEADPEKSLLVTFGDP